MKARRQEQPRRGWLWPYHLSVAGMIDQFAGRWDDALTVFEESAQAADGTGTSWVSRVTGGRLQILVHRGSAGRRDGGMGRLASRPNAARKRVCHIPSLGAHAAGRGARQSRRRTSSWRSRSGAIGCGPGHLLWASARRTRRRPGRRAGRRRRAAPPGRRRPGRGTHRPGAGAGRGGAAGPGHRLRRRRPRRAGGAGQPTGRPCHGRAVFLGAGRGGRGGRRRSRSRPHLGQRALTVAESAGRAHGRTPDDGAAAGAPPAAGRVRVAAPADDGVGQPDRHRTADRRTGRPGPDQPADRRRSCTCPRGRCRRTSRISSANWIFIPGSRSPPSSPDNADLNVGWPGEAWTARRRRRLATRDADQATEAIAAHRHGGVLRRPVRHLPAGAGSRAHRAPTSRRRASARRPRRCWPRWCSPPP